MLCLESTYSISPDLALSGLLLAVQRKAKGSSSLRFRLPLDLQCAMHGKPPLPTGRPSSHSEGFTPWTVRSSHFIPLHPNVTPVLDLESILLAHARLASGCTYITPLIYPSG
jgi:hypothetical protein